VTQHTWRVEVDVFGLVVGAGLDVGSPEVPSIRSQPPLQDVRRGLADVVVDNPSGELNAVADVFEGVDFD